MVVFIVPRPLTVEWCKDHFEQMHSLHVLAKDSCCLICTAEKFATSFKKRLTNQTSFPVPSFGFTIATPTKHCTQGLLLTWFELDLPYHMVGPCPHDSVKATYPYNEIWCKYVLPPHVMAEQNLNCAARSHVSITTTTGQVGQFFSRIQCLRALNLKTVAKLTSVDPWKTKSCDLAPQDARKRKGTNNETSTGKWKTRVKRGDTSTRH